MPSESGAFASADQEKVHARYATQSSLLDISGVCRSFPKGSGEDLLVLEKVDLTIRRAKSSVCSAGPDQASRHCCASSPD